MTRKKHPQSRAERLRIKQEHEKKFKTEEHIGCVRRKLTMEQLKDQETRDELQRAEDYLRGNLAR